MKTNDPRNRQHHKRVTAGEVDKAALKDRISQLPEIDTARVVAVHTRISQSDYVVPARQLADKILDFEQSLEAPISAPAITPRPRKRD